jgi:hypothetical protein
MLVKPIWRTTFTRNRPTCATEYAKSTSPIFSNRSTRSAGTMASAIVEVSRA